MATRHGAGGTRHGAGGTRHGAGGTRDEPRAPVTAAEHIADRPSWDCAACGRPWPCADARDDLRSQYAGSPTALSVYLASAMHDAIEDLPPRDRAASTDLYGRFLSWVEPAAREG